VQTWHFPPAQQSSMRGRGDEPGRSNGPLFLASVVSSRAFAIGCSGGQGEFGGLGA